jgi:putative NADH-flavin reductase
MNKDKLRATGTGNIVQAMNKTGVKRLVCLSAFGTGDSWDALPFHYKYIIVPLAMRHLFADHEQQERAVKNSALDWVVVRAANFSKGPRTGSYRHEFTAADAPPKLKISQADVADFMLKQLTSDTYRHKTPGLSY